LDVVVQLDLLFFVLLREFKNDLFFFPLKKLQIRNYSDRNPHQNTSHHYIKIKSMFRAIFILSALFRSQRPFLVTFRNALKLLLIKVEPWIAMGGYANIVVEQVGRFAGDC